MLYLFLSVLWFIDVMVVLGSLYGLFFKYKINTAPRFFFWIVMLASIVIYCFRWWKSITGLFEYHSTGNPILVFCIPVVALIVMMIIKRIHNQES